MVRQDVERLLDHPGDLLDELDVTAEVDEAQARREPKRISIEAALAGLATEETTYGRMLGKSCLSDDELLKEGRRIASERDVLPHASPRWSPHNGP